eukprot:460347_1
MGPENAYLLCLEDGTLVGEIIELSFVGLALLIIIPISVYGYWHLAKSRVLLVFKYMFIACTTLAFIELSGFIAKRMVCYYHMPHPIHDIILSTSFITYGLLLSHVFFLWLLRLYYTFDGSAYEKSTGFFIIITLSFCIILIVSAASGFIFMFEPHNEGSLEPILSVMGSAEVALAIIGVSGYLLVSGSVLYLFLRSLYKLITSRVVTIRFKTKQTLRQKTTDLHLNSNEQVLTDCISKYFILGTSSLFTTLIVCVIGMLYLVHVFEGSDARILKLAVIVDVVNHVLCVYLQCNHATPSYDKMCQCCLYMVGAMIEKKAANALGVNTYDYYSKQFVSKTLLHHVDIASDTSDIDEDALLQDL